MTDHKFTDDDVIKALEICTKSKCWRECEDMGCPAATKHGCYFYLRTVEDYEGVVQDEMLKDALALINSQKAMIESLNAVHADMTESLRLAAEANKDMQAELKSLKHRYDLAVTEREANVKGFAETLKTIKAEAIKEFAERLKEKAYPDDSIYTQFVVDVEDIEGLVKEMTEELK